MLHARHSYVGDLQGAKMKAIGREFIKRTRAASAVWKKTGKGEEKANNRRVRLVNKRSRWFCPIIHSRLNVCNFLVLPCRLRKEAVYTYDGYSHELKSYDKRGAARSQRNLKTFLDQRFKSSAKDQTITCMTIWPANVFDVLCWIIRIAWTELRENISGIKFSRITWRR